MAKILIIDDEIAIVEDLSIILSLEDYEVVSATNGATGLEMAHTEQPDLILCDISMPQMNGFEVLKALRADQTIQHIPFVIMSANDPRKSEQAQTSYLATAIVNKPFLVEEMLKTIADLLA